MSTKQVCEDSGEYCGNCRTWRRLCDDYFIEKCPHCGDEEIYIFETEDEDIP
jgi:predicted RNA-binding Zn-ribbon protein involved in translation (DUF1610 family)